MRGPSPYLSFFQRRAVNPPSGRRAGGFRSSAAFKTLTRPLNCAGTRQPRVEADSPAFFPYQVRHQVRPARRLLRRNAAGAFLDGAAIPAKRFARQSAEQFSGHMDFTALERKTVNGLPMRRQYAVSPLALSTTCGGIAQSLVKKGVSKPSSEERRLPPCLPTASSVMR